VSWNLLSSGIYNGIIWEYDTLSDEDHKNYNDGQNNSPYTGSSGQSYENWANGNREYKSWSENLNRNSFQSNQSSNGPRGFSQGDYNTIYRPIKSHYRGMGATAAAITMVGGYLSYTSISSTYGFYVMILSAMALGILILSFFKESEWYSISLLIIGGPLLWSIVQLEKIHYFSYDESNAPALFGGLMVLFVSPGIVVAGVRGLFQNRERLLAVLSIIYLVLLTVWAIWTFETWGPNRV
jgi:hypothetical protein